MVPGYERISTISALILLALIAAACVVVAFAESATVHTDPAGAAEAPAKTDCGTYRTTSVYEKGRVLAIRGVSCRKARRVAKTYDHDFEAPGRWKCALAHGGGRALFSCGDGDKSGNIRDWPHALVAKGVGKAEGPRI